ncbi:MAG: hypothetical protein JZU62_03385 [Sulfuricurvum sp.]|uniref:hypothetical protein n=1 Tax=Sulfuricurvum sp. TaxID=2025608 RepID=UPI0025DF11C9|nr:hypothetical protein [Sulfuricurvum sp.]MBV5320705.1 hypothetical protein [Sulfuricurvum sp.]
MRFSWIAISALLAFSGCAQKGTFDLFKMDETHERAVEQLRTDAIVLSLETKAIISSLYLNHTDPATYHEGENFIVAVYFEKDDKSYKSRDLESDGYKLTLNGKKATLIEPLGEKDPRRSLIPIQNNWNRFYFVQFNSELNSSLALQLEKNQTGSVVLNYQK